MAIHVQDEEADWLVRDFARRRGVGITAAIKLAIREASSNEAKSLENYRRRVQPILDEVRSMKSIERVDMKDFMDTGWGEAP